MSGFGPITCPKCGHKWMGTLGSPNLSAFASTEEFNKRVIAMCPNRAKHKESNNENV